MSQASLLNATKQFLIANVKINSRPLKESIIDITPDGHPYPGFGELFISIHPGGFRAMPSEVLYTNHSINITINMRIEGTPTDRVGTQNVILAHRGIEEIAQQLIEAIHMNQSLINLANTLVISEFNNPVNVWTEPLRFSSASPPRIVGSEWFVSEQARKIGLVQTLSFADAIRIQYAAFQPEIGPDIPFDEFPTLFPTDSTVNDLPSALPPGI